MDAHAEAQIEAAVRRLLDNVADDIEADAQRIVPVDTGHLRSTIHRGPVEGHSVKIHADADYAAYVELGTRHMDAQPYLKPALYRKREY